MPAILFSLVPLAGLSLVSKENAGRIWIHGFSRSRTQVRPEIGNQCYDDIAVGKEVVDE
ncbi:MAG: hypothetical protein JZU65_20880 [Chlorobium sp.]|nr:hypothetical protein [Chlorobium sp.]